MSDAKPTGVNLTIDGKEVQVAPGSTILQAAEKVGKHVPHFCYHPGLPIVGQCRMCFVEIEGMPKLATACSQPVAEGMKVQTETPKVKAGQNSTLEFILLNHPLDCPICDRGGECKLQDFTYEYGPPLSRMVDEKVLREKHKPVSEQVVLDQERCILCTRCVRFSSDVDGRAELVVNNRGNASVIDVFEDRPMHSKFAGNVVDLCPVGALTAKDFRFAARPWELKTHEAVCTGCAVGCNVTIDTKHRHPGIERPDHRPPSPQVVRLMPRENAQVNTWWMCDKGRWGYHFHNDNEKRLVAPQVRRVKNSPLENVSLREVQAALDSQKGDWEFWIDDAFPQEGIAWARELAASWSSRGRKVTSWNPSKLGDALLAFWKSRASAPWVSNPADWTGIKTVVATTDARKLEDVAPILALRLGQAARKGQLKWEVQALEDFTKVAASPEVAYLVPVPKTEADLKAMEKLPADAKLVILFTQANSRGLLNEGIAPAEVAAHSLGSSSPKGPVFFFGQRTQNPISEALRAYLAKASFRVVADSFASAISQDADIVLPLTPLYESEATMTNIENRKQLSKGVHLHHPNVAAIERGGAVVSPSLRLL